MKGKKTLKEAKSALPDDYLSTRSGAEQFVSAVVKETNFSLAYELAGERTMVETVAVMLLAAWPKELCWRVVATRPPVASATLVGTLRRLLTTEAAVALLERLNVVVDLSFKVGPRKVSESLGSPSLEKTMQWMGAIIDAKHLELADSEEYVMRTMQKLDQTIRASAQPLAIMPRMLSLAAGYRTCVPLKSSGRFETLQLDL